MDAEGDGSLRTKDTLPHPFDYIKLPRLTNRESVKSLAAGDKPIALDDLQLEAIYDVNYYLTQHKDGTSLDKFWETPLRIEGGASYEREIANLEYAFLSTDRKFLVRGTISNTSRLMETVHFGLERRDLHSWLEDKMFERREQNERDPVKCTVTEEDGQLVFRLMSGREIAPRMDTPESFFSRGYLVEYLWRSTRDDLGNAHFDIHVEGDESLLKRYGIEVDEDFAIVSCRCLIMREHWEIDGNG